MVLVEFVAELVCLARWVNSDPSCPFDLLEIVSFLSLNRYRLQKSTHALDWLFLQGRVVDLVFVNACESAFSLAQTLVCRIVAIV